MSPTRFDAAYLAGIIDGEGSISAATHTGRSGAPQLRICIGNTSEVLVQHIQSIWGGGYSSVQSVNPNGRVMYNWSLTCTVNCINLLRAVQPFLKVKGRQTSLAIEWYEDLMANTRNSRNQLVLTEVQKSRRAEIVVELRLLNKRGKSVEF